MRVMKWLSLAWLAIVVIAGAVRFLVKLVPVSLDTIELVYWMFQLVTVLVWTAALGLPALLVGWGVALARRRPRGMVHRVTPPSVTPDPAAPLEHKRPDYFQKGGRWLT